ncbi:hypothetical protein P4S57_12775 [Pseudoalteromonas sp. Hal273]
MQKHTQMGENSNIGPTNTPHTKHIIFFENQSVLFKKGGYLILKPLKMAQFTPAQAYSPIALYDIMLF